jgi:hypothetical protein
MAGDRERALRYSRAAGEHASAHFAHVEAAQHLGTALGLALEAGDDATAARLREELAREFADLGRVPDAFRELDAALETYVRGKDRAGQARVHQQRAWVNPIVHESAVPEEWQSFIQKNRELSGL